MTKIIGFTGKKFHGKDTAGAVLMDAPYNYQRINFAEALKEICVIVYGITTYEMTSPEVKEKPLERWPFMTPRQIMQEVGEALRSVHPDTWTMCWRRAAEKCSRVVVTDVRYPNEADLIKEMGGHLIRIKRPDIPDNEFSSHSSETQIDNLPADVEIINDRTPADLQAEVEVLMRHFYA